MEEVGKDIHTIKPGDPVILSFPPCGMILTVAQLLSRGVLESILLHGFGSLSLEHLLSKLKTVSSMILVSQFASGMA